MEDLELNEVIESLGGNTESNKENFVHTQVTPNSHKNLENDNSRKFHEEQIVAKTIKCWNCQNLMKVKPEWSLVQCPLCEKTDKINNRDQPEPNLKYNPQLNHFDTSVLSTISLVYKTIATVINKTK